MAKKGKSAPDERCLKDELIQSMKAEALPANVVSIRPDKQAMAADANLLEALKRSCASCGRCAGCQKLSAAP